MLTFKLNHASLSCISFHQTVSLLTWKTWMMRFLLSFSRGLQCQHANSVAVALSRGPPALFSLSTFQFTLGAEELGQCDTSHRSVPASPSTPLHGPAPAPHRGNGTPLIARARACRCTPRHALLPDDLLQSR